MQRGNSSRSVCMGSCSPGSWGGVLGDGNPSLVQVWGPSHGSSPSAPGMLVGRVGFVLRDGLPEPAEGSWGWDLFRFCARTGGSVPVWDPFLGGSSSGESQRLSRLPGAIPPLHPPGFIPFFPKFPALFLIYFFGLTLSLHFWVFFSP